MRIQSFQTLFQLFSIISILFPSLITCLIDCDNVLSDTNEFTGTCNNKWSNLQPLVRPTQKQVGYAWIQYKLENDFASSKDAQAQIDSSPTPAVIGQYNKFYII